MKHCPPPWSGMIIFNYLVSLHQHWWGTSPPGTTLQHLLKQLHRLHTSPKKDNIQGPRNHGFLGIFGDCWGIFGIFGQILGFLVKIRSESCRRLRDLQKSIVILSNGAIWTRNVSLLKNTLPPKKMIIWRLIFLALRRSGMYRRLRDLQNSVLILSNGAVWTRNVTFFKKT